MIIWRMMKNSQVRALAEILRHNGIVSHLLRQLARKLEERADLHDNSKFNWDELEGFIEFKALARVHPFGTEAYYQAQEKYKPAIDLHMSRNPHHPEYYGGDLNKMSLIDFMEMICDWTGATITYARLNFEEGLEVQKQEFDIQPHHLYLIRLIAKELGL